MKIKIIAAVAKNGVIGRTKKPCAVCAHYPPGSPHSLCSGPCKGTGFIPANDLPWPPYKEDMAFFKKETLGQAVVMGRLTKESIPAKFFPLPGRRNIVVSSTIQHAVLIAKGAHVAWNLAEAIEIARTFGDDATEVCVIGGARLFAEALPIADELVLTLIDKEYEGDVLFPAGIEGKTERDHARVLAFLDTEGAPEFACVERRQGETPELIFTRWVRR